MNKKINRIIIGIFLFLGALYIGGSLSQYAVGDRSKEFLLLISSNVFAVISSEVFKLLVTNKLTGINPITLAITIIDSLVFPCEINIYTYIAIVIEHHVHINLINFTFLHKIIEII